MAKHDHKKPPSQRPHRKPDWDNPAERERDPEWQKIPYPRQQLMLQLREIGRVGGPCILCDKHTHSAGTWTMAPEHVRLLKNPKLRGRNPVFLYSICKECRVGDYDRRILAAIIKRENTGEFDDIGQDFSLPEESQPSVVREYLNDIKISEAVDWKSKQGGPCVLCDRDTHGVVVLEDDPKLCTYLEGPESMHRVLSLCDECKQDPEHEQKVAEHIFKDYMKRQDARVEKFRVGTDKDNSMIIIQIGDYIQKFEREAAIAILPVFREFLESGVKNFGFGTYQPDGTLSYESPVPLSRARVVKLLPALEHLASTGKVDRNLL